MTENRLDEVLLERLPDEFANATKTRLIEKDLAVEMGMSRQGINLWFQKNQIPLDKIERLMSIKGCKLTLTDLTPFCEDLKVFIALWKKFPTRHGK
ncbi:hypothetical protein LOKG_00011 [Loktanella phage pCB2051-A]|uniref:Uncharacterized protein n=1 Tax=Loktanella phage pCB2051-A TaxID=754044 RepID=M4QRG6_9CAUD|nr:hypothetical protein LOKG_00011 [Loktanella phage pCB2051-A]AGH31448.1 hypothetical protein LOKG_00011 [Loktanella phage pCB2051-A]